MLFETDGTGAGHDWGYFGALLIGAIMPLYVMYGFDTAGSLAEETSDPAQERRGDHPGAPARPA